MSDSNHAPAVPLASQSGDSPSVAGESLLSPITVVVRHRVRRSQSAAFEEWLRGVNQAARQFPGCQGANVIRPSDAGRPDYLVLFRFDSAEHLQAWEVSEVRRSWIERLTPLVARAPVREHHAGMEVWFTPPAGRAAPARYKMALVTFLAIYPLILTVQWLVAPRLADWHLTLRTMATTALLVCLMTYVVMPLTVRVFERWLYGSEPD